MDKVVRGYKYPSGSINGGFKFNHKSISSFSDRFKPNHPISEHDHEFGINPNGSNLSRGLVQNSELDTPEDAVLKYIGQMLMEEEDLEHKPCMYQDCLALQAAEKSFYDVLGETYPPPPSLDNRNPNDNYDSTTSWSSPSSSNSSTAVDNFIESDSFLELDMFESSFMQSSIVDINSDSILESIGSSNTPSHVQDSYHVDPKFTQISECIDHTNQVVHLNEKNRNEVVGAVRITKRDNLPNSSRRKKNHDREVSEGVDCGRSNKQLAIYDEESDEESEMYDSVLLCPPVNPLHPDYVLCPDDNASQNSLSKGGRRRGKRQGNRKEVVDLRTLLNQCAQAVANNEVRSANELLIRIRQHSSPYGDGNERLAHFFANALGARLEGAGTALYTAFASAGISAADILKGYQVFIKACPFKLLSNYFANRSIRKLTMNATRLHIIDFGILYGFQWPCLIQRLTLNPGGPPKLRITGIELPQPGFRPAERVEKTGRRLERYCERFNVPFEYHAIAKKWETIQLEDLKIDRDEVIVVNCLYRLSNVPDDTVVTSSPRDTVLNLIKRINPDLFVHGVLNGTYNSPFFGTRFREALFHFSALFDMFEATLPREDQDRLLFEKEMFGRDVMNVIACEGTERVERPETYKQCQARNVRAGFRQLPLDWDIIEYVRASVKKGYHKDFVVDEDGNWMLQGWKGRISHAVSCWKPANV
ncbi:scarecrow-like protein 14 [Actinidia eriantha]|uniref:scarecrow-like protein 14 n=1 Tax=Actinidia eriantha TaxID=165200 RepID=UPI002584CEC2|nr:scarecrow-like protein 14 [Actinidia eriantha]